MEYIGFVSGSSEVVIGPSSAFIIKEFPDTTTINKVKSNDCYYGVSEINFFGGMKLAFEWQQQRKRNLPPRPSKPSPPGVFVDK